MRSEDADGPSRKRRTRGHVIEDISENHLERKVLLKGHVLRRPERDYGVDVTMFHFAEDGQIENGEIRFQLKATDNLKIVREGRFISFPIKTGDLHYWGLEIYPFILIIFDALTERSYWLHVQEFIGSQFDRLDWDRETINIHIPTANKLTVKSIGLFRRMSLETVENLRNQGGFQDVTRKPR